MMRAHTSLEFGSRLLLSNVEFGANGEQVNNRGEKMEHKEEHNPERLIAVGRTKGMRCPIRRVDDAIERKANDEYESDVEENDHNFAPWPCM